MTPRLPSFRIHNAYGDVVLRDGLVLSFFMRHSHLSYAAGLWRALEKYRAAIPPGSLAWYVTDEGEWDPLDDKGWAFIRHKILETEPLVACGADLEESMSEVGAYNFEYEGGDLHCPLAEGKETYIGAVAFTLPTEYLLEHGPGHVRALALELARELPFSFGYVSLAFLSPAGFQDPALQTIERMWRRFPGFEVYSISDSHLYQGTQARGAYWLTFLGEPLLGRLGGVESLRRRLPAEIGLEPLDDERLVVTLEEWPLSGDTEAGEDMSAYRTLARVLEPQLYHPSAPLLLDKEEDRRWWRRFLD